MEPLDRGGGVMNPTVFGIGIPELSEALEIERTTEEKAGPSGTNCRSLRHHSSDMCSATNYWLSALFPYGSNTSATHI